jgi:hypothetical protein
MGGVLREHHWNKWIYMFEQGISGYEIYESISTEWIEEDIHWAPARRKLQVREILAVIMQKYYEIEEAIAEEEWPEEQAQRSYPGVATVTYKPRFGGDSQARTPQLGRN